VITEDFKDCKTTGFPVVLAPRFSITEELEEWITAGTEIDDFLYFDDLDEIMDYI
jgi:hypothetical protein